jgi:hypothetical protein
MVKLDEDDLQSRLKYDYQTVMMMYSPLMEVQAYRNLDDLLARRDPVTSVAEAGSAKHYRVLYKIRTLVGRGRYSEQTIVRFDLDANNNYPLSEPACWVIESELPWTPHFREHTWICIGPIWKRAGGNILLGELIVHVAKLLNFDEPPYEDPEYGGWNPEAVEYWETKLHRQPLTANLVYPKIPRKVQSQPNEQQSPANAMVSFRQTEEPGPLVSFRAEAASEHQPSLITFRPL